MTVPTTLSSIIYTSTGVTATYAVTWGFARNEDLIVFTINAAATVVTQLALTTDFTVTGAGVPTGGTITLVAGIPASGIKIFIASDPEQIQQTLLEQGSAFNPAAIMAALDLLTREAQANRRLASVSLQLPVSESLGAYTVVLPPVPTRALKGIIFDSLGNVTVGAPLASGTVSAPMIPVVAAASLPIARSLLGVNTAGWINVRDYPYLAVGNGTTDDTAAIQAAIIASEMTGATVYFPAGVYRTTSSLTVTAACSLVSDSRPGPRVYNSAGPYGGAEIRANWSVATNTDPSAFAIQIDVGTIGSEGYANVLVAGIGLVHTDADGGGIYVEGSVGVEIRDSRFSGDLDQWNAGTANGIGIFCRDMIVSHIHDCQFFRAGWGVMADDYFNENTIENCDFFNVYHLPIGIWAATNDSLRNTIARNNFTGDPGGAHSTSAIKLGGKVGSCTITENTFEAIRLNVLFANDTQPMSGASLGVYPRNIIVSNNIFIACCGGQAGGVDLSVGASVDNVVVAGNSIHNPTVNNTALVGTTVSSTFVYLFANQLGGKAAVSGNPLCAVIDHSSYRNLPVDSSEADKSAWTGDNPAALWQNGTGIRCWQGTRAADLAQQGVRTDTGADATPSAVGISLLLCNTGSDYDITAIDDGRAGQILSIHNSAAGFSPTLKQGTSLKLSGSSDKILAHNGGRILMQCIGGNVWEQIGTMISP